MHRGTRDETFWDFSLRTYGAEGVPAACLALQDELGADVNLVLYCCWAGGRAAPLDDDAFAQALAFSRQWANGVVQPLRAARRWMKQAGCASQPMDPMACMALRERIKAVELQAEKLQQLALASLPLPPDRDEGLTAVAANLVRYCAAIDAGMGAATRERLLVIVRAAFPKAGPTHLQAVARALQAA